MKTKFALLSILFLALALTSLTPLYADGATEVALAPAQANDQAVREGVVVGADPLGLFDPLSGAVQTSCPATCFEAQSECKSSCGGRFICIEYFSCDNADPCSYQCSCTATCPPGP